MLLREGYPMGTIMLKLGDPAPPIRLQTDTGEPFDLESLRGKKVILFFYPKASTPGCTIEACEFRDSSSKFQNADAVVLGISPDAPAKQTKFKEKYGLTYPLLCDVDHKVAEAYGVWKQKSLMGHKYMGVERTSFLIDEQGRIARVFERVKPKGHAEETFQALS